jgi:5-formyltetrahydrofolate cyclo-ligase
MSSPKNLGGHFDIRSYKQRLRKKYTAIRSGLTQEQRRETDSLILGRLLRSAPYRDCATLLCYVSTDQEADTRGLIEQALADGKRVCVPCCIKGTREMSFHIIESLHELVPRAFGILEPDPEKSPRLTDFSGSICIVPGLAFDFSGHRLGYGGGYYDRFLKAYEGAAVGICYQSCMRRSLIHGRYDVACDYVVTEKGIRSCGRPPHRKGPPS